MPRGVYERTEEGRLHLREAAARRWEKYSRSREGTVSIRGRRVRIRINGQQVPLAHINWMNVHGSVPAPGLGRKKGQYKIHHVDLNTLNDDPENLQLMETGDHMSLHCLLRKLARLGQGSPVFSTSDNSRCLR